jgi:malate dehydrogenase (oxaloacetate-decarboxylating)
MDINTQALDQHRKLKGKITTALRDSPNSKDKLSLYYTPGVAAVSTYCAQNPDQMRDYTWTNSLVAVISDGSAVLGLGDIGPYGAMPVMEGKSMLFKHFANIDSVPIVLQVHDVESIISTIVAIAPSFGAINLEDFAAPKCFEIERRLKEVLNIPVMHDDQHGTAVVVLAGLINSMRILGKNLSECRVVVIGAGAAGSAVAKIISLYANPNIIVVDSKGIIEESRTDLDQYKLVLSSFNKDQQPGTLDDALRGADIVIGLSRPSMITVDHIKSMASSPIVFALANPDPEIMPEIALSAGAAIVASGRSDYPNQVNNALAFPGIFRGALSNGVKKISDAHKIAAAEALASLVANPTPDKIIPSPFDQGIVATIARVIV